MLITPEGYAVLENDSHLSRWIEEHKRLDCDGNLDRICELFQPGDSVVDAGAALGDHTYAYARRVGPTGKVFAIEANPIQVECLRHNMQLFPQVQICPIAIGDGFGCVKLNPEPNVSASYLTRSSGGDGAMPIYTLDGILACAGPIRFIKMDIEGFELFALRGAVRTISRFRPKILMEINHDALARAGSSAQAIFDFLSDNGYQHRPFIGDGTEKQYDLLAESMH